MAGDWIKFELATSDKAEVFELATVLGIDPDAVVGKLLRVWAWYDQHSEDGNAPVTIEALLDRLVCLPGFVKAVENVGWMVRADGRLALKNFSRHNGKTAKNRALGAKRAALHKGKSNATTNDKVTLDALPREEKRREYNPLPLKGEILDPLHAQIIRIITPSSKCDRPRQTAEMRAWKKWGPEVTPEDVEQVQWFYSLPKSEKSDETWRRKCGVTQLINQWTEQVELAEAMKRRIKSQPKRREAFKSA
jgi:hypothetical protein